MFQSKKKKIQRYLEERRQTGAGSPFDELLADCLSGSMKETLTNFGIRKVSVHIDWLPGYRCIGVQGVYHGSYLDLQIERDSISIGYDPVEPDEHCRYPLESREQVYTLVKQTLGK